MVGEWWNGLGPQLQIFYGIGIVSALALVVQALLLLLGVGGHDGDVGVAATDVHVDVGADAHSDASGLHVLSVRSITAFFAGFGWTGVIGTGQGLSTGLVLLVAVAVGVAFMMLVYYLMSGLYSLRDSGTLDYRNAVGKVGTVYVPIPPGQSGAGQIQIVLQGSLRTMAAYTRGGQRIASQTRVKVVEVADAQTLLVEPVGAEAKAN
jgi:membrane protein implicated in regulation of membrane protease activity